MRHEKGTMEVDPPTHREQASVEALRLLEADAEEARPQVARVLRKLGVSLHEQAPRVAQLVRKCGLTRAAVAVPFRVDLGQRLSDYIKKTYFEMALWFLFHTKSAVEVVGQLAGFSDRRQFKRAVDRLLGISPEELELKVGLVAEKADLPGIELHSRRCWREVRKGALEKAQAVEIWELVQWLYPKAAKLWLREASQPPSDEKYRINTALMESFWELLVTLSKAEQRQLVKEGIRCRSAEFFHFLCGKSLEVGREEPDRGVEVMELALEFLHGSAEKLGAKLPGLEAQGLARLANAHRLASDIRSAKRCMAEARATWKGVENRPDLVEAEIDYCEATLHVHQGDLRAARKLFDKAIGLCEARPPGRLLVQCLGQRSAVVGYAGDSEGAIRDLRAAEAVLAQQDEPRLKLIIAGNLALFHVLGGQVAEAEAQLAQAWELCDEAGDPVIRQHLFWTQGLVHHARGELEAAARELEKAGRGFKKLRQPGYRAMVALELALVRYEQCRFDEVVRLSAMAVPVLEHFQHVSGVGMALKMLREAVGAQKVTREVLEKVRAAIHDLWRDPTLSLDDMET